LGKEVYGLDKKSRKATKKLREVLKKVMKEEKKRRKTMEKRNAKTRQKGKGGEITGGLVIPGSPGSHAAASIPQIQRPVLPAWRLSRTS
jgi:hypothetical protein